jgi:hypothetical protein
MSTPFKLRGTPFKRNFGGSPLQAGGGAGEGPTDALEDTDARFGSAERGNFNEIKDRMIHDDPQAGSPILKADDKKKIDLSDKSEEELAAITKRNVDAVKKEGDNSVYIDNQSTEEDKKMVYDYFRDQPSLANDSLNAVLEELEIRFEDDKKKDKKKTK